MLSLTTPEILQLIKDETRTYTVVRVGTSGSKNHLACNGTPACSCRRVSSRGRRAVETTGDVTCEACHKIMELLVNRKYGC